VTNTFFAVPGDPELRAHPETNRTLTRPLKPEPVLADERVMWTRLGQRDERGYTLQEVLTVVAIVGILVAIAIIILFALLERWRVEAAASQFAADLRLAHTRATNQLTDWRVVFMPDGSPVERCSSEDYCMIKLSAPYGAGDPTPTRDSKAPRIARKLPEGTKIREVTFDPDCSAGDAGAVIPPSRCGPDATRTLEFSSNGTVRTLRPGQSGTVRISSDDGSPWCDIVFNSATSRIRISPIAY
jgi:prepilin-type N-terminal cleavage/methylation domain-containing protein